MFHKNEYHPNKKKKIFFSDQGLNWNVDMFFVMLCSVISFQYYLTLQVIATAVAMAGNKRQVYDTINNLMLHLKNFGGISRRFEIIGNIYGCHILDDYAHHPTEVSAVLQAARQRFPFKALLVVFQPHTNRY